MGHRKRTGGTYTPPAGRGSCPTGKVQFATRKQARWGRRDGATLSVYRCTDCDWWHLGHLPQRVRNGAVDKDAWLNSTREDETA